MENEGILAEEEVIRGREEKEIFRDKEKKSRIQINTSEGEKNGMDNISLWISYEILLFLQHEKSTHDRSYDLVISRDFISNRITCKLINLPFNCKRMSIRLVRRNDWEK